MTNAFGRFPHSWDRVNNPLTALDIPNRQPSKFNYFPNLKDKLPQRVTHVKPDSTLLSRFTYDYNAVRQIAHWTQERSGASPVQWVFDYDAADQLTNAVATQSGTTVGSYAYSYDAAENRIA